MRVDESAISCGVYQLTDVGENPSEAAYKQALEEFANNGAVLIASVPSSWKKACKFLKSKKFKQVNRAIENPNSGNKIVVFVKNFSAKERKRFTPNYRYY